MTNEIQIQQTKIDWLKIIELALNKKDWGKTYTLYKYGDVIVNIELQIFNFPENKATFKIICAYEGKPEYAWNNYDTVNYLLNNFNVDEFKSLINRRIKSLISNILSGDLRNIARNKFNHLITYVKNEKNKLKLIDDYGFLEDYEKALTLSPALQETVIESIYNDIEEDLNKDYYDKLSTFVDNNLESGNNCDNKNLFNFCKNLENENKKEVKK